MPITRLNHAVLYVRRSPDVASTLDLGFRSCR